MKKKTIHLFRLKHIEYTQYRAKGGDLDCAILENIIIPTIYLGI